jgi:hypothetical protein
VSGAFVAVAVARDDMTATLVRDHLRLHGIAANFPPITHIPWSMSAYIWVPSDDEADAVAAAAPVGKQEWYTEP